MAGPFGFEAEHYDMAVQIGERRLLPAVRRAAKEALVIANGFSCRTQIAQGSDRHPLHLSELLCVALEAGPHGPARPYPERNYVSTQHPRLETGTAALAGVALVGGVLAARVLSRRTA
jgi:hypothetical protein